MNEFYKSIIGIIIAIVVYSAIWFFGGYFLCDRIATRKLENANQQLEAQQRKYDELIRKSEERIRETETRLRESNERISNIRNELLGKVSSNGEAVTELTTIIEQIEKQRINL